jgi:hypothetical protein
MPACKPAVTEAVIVVVSPGKYTDCDVDDDGILITP